MNSNTRPASGDAGLDHPDPLVPRPGTQREFLETLQGLDAVVWEMDVETWSFTFVSERAERMFGYALERWTEAGFWQDTLVDEEDREWCTDYCLTATRENRNHAFIYRARTADGRALWLKDVVRVITDDAGRPVLLRGVMVDVTREHPESAPQRERELEYADPSLEDLRQIVAA